MGTRGAIGFISPTGELFATYNHYDSYPSGLGANVQGAVADWNTIPHLQFWADDKPVIRFVDQSEQPTPEERAEFADVTDPKVSTGKDWYATLRSGQGDFAFMLKRKIAFDYAGFLSDSLFCEWAYLVDLRSDEFVILKGFNKNPALVPEYIRTDHLEMDEDSYTGCFEIWRGSLDRFKALNMKALEEAIEGDVEDDTPGEYRTSIYRQLIALSESTGAPVALVMP